MYKSEIKDYCFSFLLKFDQVIPEIKLFVKQSISKQNKLVILNSELQEIWFY